MKKGRKSNIIPIIIFIAGLSLMLYPSVANYWNSSRQTQVIVHYAEAIANMDTEEYNAVINSAKEYNQLLLKRFNSYLLEGNLEQRYNEELNFGGDGVMGYIQIDKIDVMLPVCHSTAEEVLQVAIGHIEWSSLPVGGENTHCVISGHRGLPSARLFTDLDKLTIGDTFVFHVMNQVITYQIDQIKIVEPHITEDLMIEEGKDYCTLVTCTPYGVNSHRLLVRGTRVENLADGKVRAVTADALLIDPLLVAPFVALPMLVVLLIILFIPKKKKKGGENYD